MDLLAPWKMCLQCLPVFSSDPPLPPPPPSKAVAALPLHVTSENSGASTSTKNSSENDSPEGEKPSFSDSSLTHDHQHQDLPLSDYAKEVDSPVYTPAETKPVAEGDEMHVNSQHNQGHSFFHSHSHSHDKDPPLHPISYSMSNPLSSSQFEGDGSSEEVHHHHTHNQHSHMQNVDSHDDDFHVPTHPPSMTSQPLETSHSTPANIELMSGLHGEYNNSDDDSVMNGSSSTLKTSQSEPIDGVGMMRVRRRDQLKHQLKDLRNQLKQGGHLLKEEGSKHLQSMVSTINKQAQQIEESGSFFMVPRNHDMS